MPRIYLNQPLYPGEMLELPDHAVRHLQVLRLKPDALLTLFCGDGQEYPARLISMQKRAAQVAILSSKQVSRESPLWIGLAQSLSSTERMEFTLQKGVEMGVNVFQPIETERCARLAAERIEKRLQRWQDIVIAACEQCGRNRIPEVLPILSFNQWLAQPLPDALKLILSLSDQSSAQPQAPKKIWLMAGPEGGFTPVEEKLAQTAGWQPVTFGPRILRTETAALSAVSALQTLWGDYRLF